MALTRHFLMVAFLVFLPCSARADDPISRPPGARSELRVSANLEGTWNGVLNIGTTQLQVSFHIAKNASGFTGTLDVPQQGGKGIPFDRIDVKDGTVAMRVPKLAGVYSGKFTADGNQLEGVWMQGGQRAPLTLQRSSLTPGLVPLAFAVGMVLLSALFLRLACGLTGNNLPGWRRAILSTLLVAVLSYLTFDFFAYLIMRSMQDVFLQIPPWYGFKFWVREPLPLKWFIISHVGVVKYLPIVFALCAAGTLQVAVLQAEVTFRIGLMITLLQWGVTALAGYIVLLLMGIAVDRAGWLMPSSPVTHTPSAADRNAAPSNSPQDTDAAPSALQVFKTESKEHLDHAWTNLKSYGDQFLVELKEQMAPFTEKLPESVQQFLEDGGWWAVLGVTAFVAILWVRSVLRRLYHALKPGRRKKKKKVKSGLALMREDLAEIGDAYTDEHTHTLTVKNMPGRLRLVVLSMGAKSVGKPTDEMVDRVLDWIKPGLAAATAEDYPRVRHWPPCYSVDGFAIQLANLVTVPEPVGAASHWVLVSGQVKMGQVIVNVGLAIYTDKASTMRNLKVKREDWLGIVGVRETMEMAGAR